MEANHDMKECEKCAWNRGRGSNMCEAFTDKRNVILNGEGKCNGLSDEEQKRKIEKAIERYKIHMYWGK